MARGVRSCMCVFLHHSGHCRERDLGRSSGMCFPLPLGSLTTPFTTWGTHRRDHPRAFSSSGARGRQAFAGDEALGFSTRLGTVAYAAPEILDAQARRRRLVWPLSLSSARWCFRPTWRRARSRRHLRSSTRGSWFRLFCHREHVRWRRDRSSTRSGRSLCWTVPSVTRSGVEPCVRTTQNEHDGWFARTTRRRTPY